jgi:serine/threonine protein kinase
MSFSEKATGEPPVATNDQPVIRTLTVPTGQVNWGVLGPLILRTLITDRRVSTGQQFVGNYRMFHLIRAGAIYEIWAVRPISETTVYAMKWLPPGPKYSRQMVSELRREYQVGVALDHPAVIRTFEFNTTANGAYLLLELFKVPNLKQQIVADHDSLQHRAKEILTGAAAGLTHLHERGWVHRDIKPDNFLLRDDNVVKLIDFNLARKPPSAIVRLLGIKSTVQGTHSYMAPEQIRGQAVGFAADIYSFGCMVHEFFAGKPPFTANSKNELLQRHLRSKPPDLTVFDKNITPEFAHYVQTMMAKDPRERPANMKDVMMEIKTQRIHYNKPQPPPERPAEGDAEPNQG